MSTPASNFLRAAPRKCRPSSVRRRRVRFHHTHCGRRFPSGHGGRLLNLRSRKKKPKKIKTRREYTHISPRVIGCASMPVASVDCFLKKQKKKEHRIVFFLRGLDCRRGNFLVSTTEEEVRMMQFIHSWLNFFFNDCNFHKIAS